MAFRVSWRGTNPEPLRAPYVRLGRGPSALLPPSISVADPRNFSGSSPLQRQGTEQWIASAR
jgi:hypothetical protein